MGWESTPVEELSFDILTERDRVDDAMFVQLFIVTSIDTRYAGHTEVVSVSYNLTKISSNGHISTKSLQHLLLNGLSQECDIETAMDYKTPQCTAWKSLQL